MELSAEHLPGMGEVLGSVQDDREGSESSDDPG